MVVQGAATKAGIRSRLAFAAAIVLGCACMWPSTSDAFVGCKYSAGELRVFATAEDDNLTISREGEEINLVAESDEYGDGPSILLACRGGDPSVTNTDHISIEDSLASVLLDLGPGPLAPGATPEADGTSEIEITATPREPPAFLLVAGSDGADTINLGRTASGALGANLNAAAEPTPDADLELVGRQFVTVLGRRGADSISGQGGPGFTGPFGAALFMSGDDGNDTLTGGPRFDFIYDGDGRDRVVGSLGREYVISGEGRDRIATGPGADLVYSRDRGGKPDRVNCGGGPDQFVSHDGAKGGSCKVVTARHARFHLTTIQIIGLYTALFADDLTGGD